ncbi:MAG: TonB-dependent receptor [Rhizomicrobium sp.]
MIGPLALAMVGCIGFHGAASAQDASAAPAPDVETVVVTGSQIQRSGFEAPTPMTTVSEKELQLKAVVNISSLQYDIPEFKPQQDVSNNAAPIGGANLDLRGLGPTRTLVLLDGRRLEASNPVGGIDVSLIPGALVNRVEIVTGGASAAYGSDAVSGVVNISLDNKFEGLKAQAQYGQTGYDDVKEADLSGAWGTSFAGGRGHLVVAADVYNNTGENNEGSRPWGAKNGCLLINPKNSTSGPITATNIIATGCTWSQMTDGGLIDSGVAKGTAFGVGGTPYPFQYGQYVGVFWQQGGGGGSEQGQANIFPKERRDVGYGRLTYDFNENITGYVDVLYAHETGFYHLVSNYDNGTLTIHNDNAFLPTAIKNEMAGAGQTTFLYGRSGIDGGFGGNYSAQNDGRYAAGLEGVFGDGWSWDAHAQISRNQYYATVPNNRIQANWLNAVDSVINPATGQPVCRSTLANPNNGCVPADVFGINMVSPASIAYYEGTSWTREEQSQNDYAVNLRGNPFSIWAGPVSVATGFEYRSETIDGTSDPISLASGWRSVNQQPINGAVNVKEGYVETVIPLANDYSWAKLLEVNAAARVTDYSTSGTVETWKVGLNYMPIDDLRLRGTISHDIRAPTINELFSGQNTTLNQPVTDPFNNNRQSLVLQLNGGNPALRPEISDTRTFGLVYQPSYLPGLRTSIDYYNINIAGAITTTPVQTIIQDCFLGQTIFCPLITRDPVTQTITKVQATLINSQTLKTSGVDFEMDYDFPVDDWFKGTGGDLDFRVLGTYVDHLISINNNVAIDNAGQVMSGVPHWRVNIGATYTNEPYTFSVLVRNVQGGLYNATYVQGVDINNNNISGRTYVDLSTSYDYDEHWTFYARGVNVFDVDPPLVPQNFSLANAAQSPYYDRLGARWMAGIRMRY